MDAINLHQTRFSQHTETGLSLLLASLLFITAVSSSLRSIFFPVAGVCLLAFPDTRAHLAAICKNPVSRAIFLLFGWVLLACLWSPATWNQSLLIIQKYSKLLYIPLLAVGFQYAKTRTWALYAFLGALLLTILAIYTNKSGLTHFTDRTQSSVFHNHIVTGTLFALGAWMAFFQASRVQAKEKFWLIGLGFLLSYAVLFINTSRTGYILYMILMLILFRQLLTLKQALILTCLFSMGIALCFQFSTVMHDGLETVYTNIQEYGQANKDTSIGYRIQFHLYAKSLFAKHPFIGNGTGAFTWNYLQDNPLPTWKVPHFDPHSQYWFIAVEQGVIGLLLFGLVISSLFGLAFKTKNTGPLLFAFLAIFISGCFSDSLLLVSPTGWFLVLFAAMCLGELMEKTSKIDHDDEEKLLYTETAT